MNADSIAVLRARLPYVDRRALSEAWFSALHLAGAKPAPRRGAKAPRLPSTSARATTTRRPSNAAPMVPSPSTSVRGLSVRAEKLLVPLDPMRLRRAGGAVVVPFPTRTLGYAAVRASFTIGAGSGRVQILIRRDGPVLRVVAICSTRDLDLVRRALACADLYLRLRGEAIESTVRASERSGDG